MQIGSLLITSFRNCEKLELHASEGVNVLLGDNAQGKSAILEAIYLIATSKSHRTMRDSDMIRVGDDIARVCAQVARSARNDATLEVLLSRSEKKVVRIDKVKHDRIGDLVGQLNAVIFSSLDIDMVRGEPLLRRRFMNLDISQTSPQYIYALGRYKRVLEQRNNLLKELKSAGGQSNSLDVWDSQLAGYGAAVMTKRAEFARFLANAASRIHTELTSGGEELALTYKPSPGNDCAETEDERKSALAEHLVARRDIDILRGSTSVGPHRDDLAISIGGLPARDYASQGQQRSVAVALKLAEIELMEEAAGEPPVLLLDDVTAELDESRRARVLQLTRGRCQTFVTTTRLEELAGGDLDFGGVFEVRSGKVTRR